MDRIAHINQVLTAYFQKHSTEKIMPAKDMMPYFIQAGIFQKDHKNGLPIRNVLRALDNRQQLHQIPFAIAIRKQLNTYWYFGPAGSVIKEATIKKTNNSVLLKKTTKNDSRQRDEHYVIDLCDEVLGIKASRQHRFPFLVGDSGKPLPVDAYYASYNLVIEYNEQQHTKPVQHFDKPDRLTVSGVHRGEQRKIYDKRKREILPQHGITVIDIPYTAFNCNRSGKILRNRISDLQIVKRYIKK